MRSQDSMSSDSCVLFGSPRSIRSGIPFLRSSFPFHLNPERKKPFFLHRISSLSLYPQLSHTYIPKMSTLESSSCGRKNEDGGILNDDGDTRSLPSITLQRTGTIAVAAIPSPSSTRSNTMTITSSRRGDDCLATTTTTTTPLVREASSSPTFLFKTSIPTRVGILNPLHLEVKVVNPHPSTTAVLTTGTTGSTPPALNSGFQDIWGPTPWIKESPSYTKLKHLALFHTDIYHHEDHDDHQNPGDNGSRRTRRPSEIQHLIRQMILEHVLEQGGLFLKPVRTDKQGINSVGSNIEISPANISWMLRSQISVRETIGTKLRTFFCTSTTKNQDVPPFKRLDGLFKVTSGFPTEEDLEAWRELRARILTRVPYPGPKESPALVLYQDRTMMPSAVLRLTVANPPHEQQQQRQQSDQESTAAPSPLTSEPRNSLRDSSLPNVPAIDHVAETQPVCLQSDPPKVKVVQVKAILVDRPTCFDQTGFEDDQLSTPKEHFMPIKFTSAIVPVDSPSSLLLKRNATYHETKSQGRDEGEFLASHQKLLRQSGGPRRVSLDSNDPNEISPKKERKLPLGPTYLGNDDHSSHNNPVSKEITHNVTHKPKREKKRDSTSQRPNDEQPIQVMPSHGTHQEQVRDYTKENEVVAGALDASVVVTRNDDTVRIESHLRTHQVKPFSASHPRSVTPSKGNCMVDAITNTGQPCDTDCEEPQTKRLREESLQQRTIQPPVPFSPSHQGDKAINACQKVANGEKSDSRKRNIDDRLRMTELNNDQEPPNQFGEDFLDLPPQPSKDSTMMTTTEQCGSSKRRKNGTPMASRVHAGRLVPKVPTKRSWSRRNPFPAVFWDIDGNKITPDDDDYDDEDIFQDLASFDDRHDFPNTTVISSPIPLPGHMGVDASSHSIIPIGMNSIHDYPFDLFHHDEIWQSLLPSSFSDDLY